MSRKITVCNFVTNSDGLLTESKRRRTYCQQLVMEGSSQQSGNSVPKMLEKVYYIILII